MRKETDRDSHPRVDVCVCTCVNLYFPGGPVVKNPPAPAGDTRAMSSIPGLGRCPGGGNGNSLQYSCLENPMHRGAWWATVHGVAKSRTRLSDFTFTFTMWSECYTGFLELKERSILSPKNLPLHESSFTDKPTGTGEFTENCSSRSGLIDSL